MTREETIRGHIFACPKLGLLDLFEKRVKRLHDDGKLTLAECERLCEDVAKRADYLVGPVTFKSDKEPTE